MYSFATIQSKLSDQYVLELAAPNCLLDSKSKEVDLQATVSRLHSMVLTTKNQNKKVCFSTNWKYYSTKMNFLNYVRLLKLTTH